MIKSVTELAGPAASEFPAAPATRVRRARWRNPQLVVGALLVLVSVLLGTRVVAAADDTRPVLVAARDLSPGEPLTADMVQTREVRLESGYDLYYTGPVDEGYVLLDSVRAGEMLPMSAVAEAAEVASGPEALRLVTLAVPAEEAPAGLTAGDSVDVWVTPADGGTAKQLASALTVTDADVGGALGASGSHATVTLTVRANGGDELDDLVGRLITSSRDGRVYLARLLDGA